MGASCGWVAGNYPVASSIVGNDEISAFANTIQTSGTLSKVISALGVSLAFVRDAEHRLLLTTSSRGDDGIPRSAGYGRRAVRLLVAKA